MKLSKKPRHWFAIAIAVVTLVVAVIQFMDFSGEPGPRWREIFLMAALPMTMAAIVINLALDRRDKNAGR